MWWHIKSLVIVLSFCVVDEGEFVPKKEMDQLNLRYNQHRDEYQAVKRDLEATQEENKILK